MMFLITQSIWETKSHRKSKKGNFSLNSMALNKHTDKLKANVEEQLERLVNQLEDLESYR